MADRHQLLDQALNAAVGALSMGGGALARKRAAAAVTAYLETITGNPAPIWPDVATLHDLAGCVSIADVLWLVMPERADLTPEVLHTVASASSEQLAALLADVKDGQARRIEPPHLRVVHPEGPPR